MNRAFADTSFYVGYYNPRDAYHKAAQTIRKGYPGRVVTTEFGLADALTADTHFAQAGFTPLLV